MLDKGFKNFIVEFVECIHILHSWIKPTVHFLTLQQQKTNTIMPNLNQLVQQGLDSSVYCYTVIIAWEKERKKQQQQQQQQ